VTTIEITLPDALVEGAKGAGLLSPGAIEDLLRRTLAADRLTHLQQARDALVTHSAEAMSQQEINAEIKAYRQEQRLAADS
jgi:hypothetical protein